jgi:hypothetical protein
MRMRNQPSKSENPRRRRPAGPRQGGLRISTTAACLAFVLLWALSPASHGEDKRLEVCVRSAAVRLEPSASSPVVANLEHGSVLTLASRSRLRGAWLYVHFESEKSGRTLSGYVLEDSVRKLFPVVKWIHISSEDEVMNPKELDLTSSYLPTIEWGARAEKLIGIEGRPFKREPVPGGEIIQYKRDIVNKRCLVEYVLSADRLVTTRFYLLEKYVDKDIYIKEYRQIKSFLTQKIGIPRADRMTWLDRTSEHQDGLLGQALSNGQVEFTAEWAFRDTEVLLTLANIQHSVVFGAEVNDVKFKNPASF